MGIAGTREKRDVTDGVCSHGLFTVAQTPSPFAAATPLTPQQPASQLLASPLAMPKNTKGKGGKNRRRGKGGADGEKAELTIKEEGQEYAQVNEQKTDSSSQRADEPDCRPSAAHPQPTRSESAHCTRSERWCPMHSGANIAVILRCTLGCALRHRGAECASATFH